MAGIAPYTTPTSYGATNSGPAFGLGLPSLNGNSISQFLRQQLADRAKKLSQQKPLANSFPATQQLFGGFGANG